ncbi:MAG: hypothetical protein KJP04_07545, partial [Arenicella sp.]|nr:hypothetical protein [Arenicella sp.]
LFSGIFAVPGPQADLTDYSELGVGQTALRRVDGKRVWVTRLSQSQRDKLAAFDSAMVVQTGGCRLATQICAISTDTGRTGVELRFVMDAPVSLQSGLPWAGGFVNPDSGMIYDLVGRAYVFQGPARPLGVVIGGQLAD